jgi:hypothetical protein
MADITSFLVQLAQDSELQQRFKTDPQGTMAAEGLSEEDQETLVSGDQDRIRATVDSSQLAGTYLMVFCIGGR